MLPADRGQEGSPPYTLRVGQQDPLLAAVSIRLGMIAPAQAGTIPHKVQSVPTAAPFLVSVAKNTVSDDRKRSDASSSTWAWENSKKNARKK